MLFAVAICGSLATPLLAQEVPARDLLDFPIGAIAEPSALAIRFPSGLWNPAAISLPQTTKLELGISALNSPIDLGVSAQLLAASLRVPHDAVVTASFVRATVTDLVRTATDPQSVGSEIPYGTTVFSLGISRRFAGITAGLATRVRTGTVDYIQRTAVSIDGGIVVDRVLGTPLRFAASTFLLSPERSRERPTLLGAADVPVYRHGTLLSFRAGAAASVTDGNGYEHYVFGSVRYATLEARGGLAQEHAFGTTSDHLRLGLDVRYKRYSVGIAREQEGAGLGAVYQFMLTADFP